MMKGFFGVMCSGKTQKLIEICGDLDEEGKTFKVCLPYASKNRVFPDMKKIHITESDDSNNKLFSRTGQCIDVDVYIDEDISFYPLVREWVFEGVDTILIDEAFQLTIKQVRELHKCVLDFAVNVCLFSISADFERNVFPSCQEILRLCDEIQCFKNAICKCCAGRLATADSLQDLQSPGEFINSNYASLCEECFELEKIKKDKKEC